MVLYLPSCSNSYIVVIFTIAKIIAASATMLQTYAVNSFRLRPNISLISAFVTPRGRIKWTVPSFAILTGTRLLSSSPGKGFTNEKNEVNKEEWEPIHVPLVFVPGMKGTHLSFEDGAVATSTKTKKKRVWLTLSNLLNIPPRPDGDLTRDLSLPLSYEYELADSDSSTFGHDDCLGIASRYPKQHRGNLVPDGIVDHIIEFNIGAGNKTSSDEPRNFVDLNFLPFYGHTTRLLREMDRRYHERLHDGKVESTNSFQAQDEVNVRDEATNIRKSIGSRGIFVSIGNFIERTSNWAFANTTKSSAEEQQSHHPSKHCRPTAVFSYDWRRSLPELCSDLHDFCETTFPGQPVQIMAHSLGGLMTFAAMRSHPEKYSPGAVVVGVPFETGIQYLQDLHKGYYTELDRCRQFTPEVQFTMSSHWSFFPISKKRLEDRFVDVSHKFTNDSTTNLQQLPFDADVSGIGKTGTTLQPKVEGVNAYFDFYNPDEWERLQIGVFGPEYDDKLSDDQRQAYKNHMRIQMAAAKEWRRKVLGEDELIDNAQKSVYYGLRSDSSKYISFPPFVACASDKVPTVNQILRRKRQPTTAREAQQVNDQFGKAKDVLNTWEYDYLNGRSVPGDGRIDYDKAFPPSFIAHKKVTLDSAHAKQMCWEESGGSFARIYEEVVQQITEYLERKPIELVEAERLMSVMQFQTATESNMTQKAVADKHGRLGIGIKAVVSKARNVRDKIRRVGSRRRFKADKEFEASSLRRKRFPFRSRRRR